MALPIFASGARSTTYVPKRYEKANRAAAAVGLAVSGFLEYIVRPSSRTESSKWRSLLPNMMQLGQSILEIFEECLQAAGHRGNGARGSVCGQVLSRARHRCLPGAPGRTGSTLATAGGRTRRTWPAAMLKSLQPNAK